jgi:PKD repeat protein
MNKFKLILASLTAILPLWSIAQQPVTTKLTEINIHNVETIEKRVFLLHSIQENEFFNYRLSDEEGKIDIFVTDDYTCQESNANADFDAFIEQFETEWMAYSNLDKNERGQLFVDWRYQLEDPVFLMINEDFHRQLRNRDNSTCDGADPFCTDNGLYQFPAGVNAGNLGSSTPPYYCSGFVRPNGAGTSNCLSTTPNPAFYYMQIDQPGNLNIYMYSTPSHDIDFDCWGPFSDINTACSQLSCSNMVDCSYSINSTENCHINNAQTGQYYILLITNYSNQSCNISFSNIGTGTTNCGILPPLVSGGGPYCVGETIYLTAQGQSGATYSWTGPAGFNSNQQNPTRPNCTLNMAGTYTCTITVGSQTNSATTEAVVIYPDPTSNFTFTSVCKGTPTQFTSTATTNPSGQTIQSYQWNFGDGQTGSGQSVTHTYAQAGNYQVTHTVSTGNGHCTDQKTQTVPVYAAPVASATAQPSTVIYGGTATLTASAGTTGSFNFHWEPANMVVNPDAQTTQTVPLQATQTFTVTVTNPQGGCSSTAQVTVSMEGSNMTAMASADQYELCEGESTTLHAQPSGGTGNYTFSWTPANTLSDPSGRNPVASPAVGTTTYSCHVSDGIISQDVDVTIMVHPNEASEMHRAICEGTSYSFFGQNLNAEGVYRHTLQTQYGCDSIVTLYLGINNIQESQFTVPEEESCDSYYWDPRGHQIVQTDHNDMTYTQSGTYHRTYKDIADCDSIVTMNVQFEYTPHPTPIYPMDPSNETPHWVVTATEFQINTYDFQLWDTNPLCYWDTVTWSCEGAPDWIVEPFGPKSKNCKLYVLDLVPDTIWLTARAFNRCAPDDGVEQKYWLVCSFYGIGEQSSNLADFSVVPNPNNGLMTLNFEHLTGKVNIKVYNMQGALIDSFETYHGGDSLSYTYAMRDKADGIYFFVASGREGTKAKKVIIQH